MQGLAELQHKLAKIVLGLKKTEPDMLPGERVDERPPAETWGTAGGGWGGDGAGTAAGGWGSSSPGRGGAASSAWGSGGGWSSPSQPAAAGWNV